MYVFNHHRLPPGCSSTANSSAKSNSQASRCSLIRPNHQLSINHTVKPRPIKIGKLTRQYRANRRHRSNRIRFPFQNRRCFLPSTLVTISFFSLSHGRNMPPPFTRSPDQTQNFSRFLNFTIFKPSFSSKLPA